jgi:plasmid maintenance system killer protein
VIKTFKNKALDELWREGKTPKIDAKMQSRVLRRLTELNAASRVDEMDQLGFNFHRLMENQFAIQFT